MFALQAMVLSYIIRFTCSLHNLTFPLNFNQYHAPAAQPFLLPSSCQACGLKGGPCMPFQRQRDEKWCMATLRKGYPWYQVWIPSGLDRLDVRSCISLFLRSPYFSINFLMKVVPCVARPIINKMFGNDKFPTLYSEGPKGM